MNNYSCLIALVVFSPVFTKSVIRTPLLGVKYQLDLMATDYPSNYRTFQKTLVVLDKK